MRIALFGIPCKEDLKGWSSGSLGNFSLVRAKCREGSDDAIVFFKQNVRRALRGAKDKNSRREGGMVRSLYLLARFREHVDQSWSG